LKFIAGIFERNEGISKIPNRIVMPCICQFLHSLQSFLIHAGQSLLYIPYSSKFSKKLPSKVKKCQNNN